MTDVDSAAYPQKVGHPAANADPAHARGVRGAAVVRGPTYFKDGEDILFMRPARLLSHSVDGTTVRLVCETRGTLNRTAQTHETRMRQFTDMPEHRGRLHVRVDVWSPAVFRVRFAEAEAAIPWAEPSFPDQAGRMLVGSPDDGFAIDVAGRDGRVIVATGEIELHISEEPFALRAYNRRGDLYWAQRQSDLFTADVFDMAVARHGGRVACFESFAVGPQEEFYGLGERFDYVARRGKGVDFWNKDAIGASSPRTYINVPFLFSTRGYGLFLHSSCRTEWEVATREASTLGVAVEDEHMDYFVIHGPDPSTILRRYAALTGFAPVPPVWSFGLWMSRNSYESWDVVREVAHGLRDRRIPADVLHLDTAWFQQDWNCDLRFATDRFAEPERHMRELGELGFRISLWQYNFVPPREDNINYTEGRARGYFARGADDKPFRYPKGTTGSWVDDAIIDFSDPEACAWYADQIKALIRMGAATIKTDFGEGIPEDAVFRNIDGRRFHNLYALVYNAVVAEAIRAVSGEHIVWARSGTAGSQRYPVHWGGDAQCSWAGLAGTVRGALSLGLSGFPFYSHDIGGFIGRPTPELYIRWAQFGLFSSHARCHGLGNDNSREPWSFGVEATAIFKRYADLRYRLLPYIYGEARRSAATAKPMVRHLVVDYPDDRNVWGLEDQYLFGDSLLVAPVLAPLDEQQGRWLYLPRGMWVDYWTKEWHASRGEWVEQPVDLATLPLYVKAGSVLPYGEERESTHNRIGPITHLEVYADGDRDVAYHYDDGATRFDLSLRRGTLAVTGLPTPPTASVYGGARANSADGARLL